MTEIAFPVGDMREEGKRISQAHKSARPPSEQVPRCLPPPQPLQGANPRLSPLARTRARSPFYENQKPADPHFAGRLPTYSPPPRQGGTRPLHAARPSGEHEPEEIAPAA